MQIDRRYLVRQASGHLTELPEQDFDRADDGIAPIASLAGRCVEMIAIVLVHDQPRRTRIFDVAFTKVYFDARGFVDAAKRELMMRLMLASCLDQRPAVERQLALMAGRGARTLPANLDRSQRHSFADQARGRLVREFAWRPDPAVLSQLRDRLGLAAPDHRGGMLPASHTLH